MADVRLTATNSEDSSVVPVACNAKGELKLEEPLVVEGPQGPTGPEGPPGPKGEDGADGQDGQDGNTFVPDPSTGSDGQVLTTNGSTCSWQDSGSTPMHWRFMLRAGQNTYSWAPNEGLPVFDGSHTSSFRVNNISSGSAEAQLAMPVHMTLTKFELRGGAYAQNILVYVNDKNETIRCEPYTWTHFPRFFSDDMPMGTQIRMWQSGGHSWELSGIRINNVELLDVETFNQMQLFSFEQLVRTNFDRMSRLLKPTHETD